MARVTDRERVWLSTFFEFEASFAININLLKKNNNSTRYVVFKPYIRISERSKEVVDTIREKLQLDNTKIGTDYPRDFEHNTTHRLSIQNFEDIEKVNNFIRSVKNKYFVNKERKEIVTNFEKAFKLIEEHGYIHNSYNTIFEEVIRQKMTLNNSKGKIENRRFKSEEWIKKIKEHLNEE